MRTRVHRVRESGGESGVPTDLCPMVQCTGAVGVNQEVADQNHVRDARAKRIKPDAKLHQHAKPFTERNLSHLKVRE